MDDLKHIKELLNKKIIPDLSNIIFEYLYKFKFVPNFRPSLLDKFQRISLFESYDKNTHIIRNNVLEYTNKNKNIKLSDAKNIHLEKNVFSGNCSPNDIVIKNYYLLEMEENVYVYFKRCVIETHTVGRFPDGSYYLMANGFTITIIIDNNIQNLLNYMNAKELKYFYEYQKQL